jgi:hypothetical protein
MNNKIKKKKEKNMAWRSKKKKRNFLAYPPLTVSYKTHSWGPASYLGGRNATWEKSRRISAVKLFLVSPFGPLLSGRYLFVQSCLYTDIPASQNPSVNMDRFPCVSELSFWGLRSHIKLQINLLWFSLVHLSFLMEVAAITLMMKEERIVYFVSLLKGQAIHRD